MKSTSECNQPAAGLPARYFEASLQSAVESLNCAVTELDGMEGGPDLALEATDIKNHIEHTRRFLVNLCVMYGVNPKVEPGSQELMYFEV